jgi:hypothetical protein
LVAFGAYEPTVKRILLLTIVAALVAASTAAAALTPTQYRAKLNTVCRGYTPKMKQQERAMAAAQKAGKPEAYGVALGKLLVLALAEDLQIETTPVPTAMHAQMTPIITTLKKADLHIRASIRYAAAGNAKGMAAQLAAAGDVAKGLNAKLDAAGLRDCGSNQT